MKKATNQKTRKQKLNKTKKTLNTHTNKQKTKPYAHAQETELKQQKKARGEVVRDIVKKKTNKQHQRLAKTRVTTNKSQWSDKPIFKEEGRTRDYILLQVN